MAVSYLRSLHGHHTSAVVDPSYRSSFDSSDSSFLSKSSSSSSSSSSSTSETCSPLTPFPSKLDSTFFPGRVFHTPLGMKFPGHPFLTSTPVVPVFPIKVVHTDDGDEPLLLRQDESFVTRSEMQSENSNKHFNQSIWRPW